MVRLLGLIALLGVTQTHPTFADQNDERWYATPPEVRQWFRSLTQPDSGTSCCGEADAYHTDSFEVSGGNYVAIITDERADAPLGRPHVRPGTKVVVPNHKIQYSAGNPTGHGIIFMRWNDETDSYGVLCYVAPGGI